MSKTHWVIQVNSLDIKDKLTDKHWKLKSALQFELGYKNNFDSQTQAKTAYDALPQYLKDESSVVELTLVHEII